MNKEIAEKILEQNLIILKQNQVIIDIIFNPPIITEREEYYKNLMRGK